ncbi:MAG: RodZ domain-containing protein [Acidiferrobacterales bacterium]
MNETTPNEVVVVLAGPGKTLSVARMQKHLSREQVAEMLHLSPQQIEALENDDFEKLPGPTYVRGYLRSYAQVLGLPPEGVIAAYAQVNGIQRSMTLSRRLVPEPEVTIRDGSVKVATLLVAGILILLALVWWHGRHVPSSSRSVADAELAMKATSTAPGLVGEPAAEASTAQSSTIVPSDPVGQLPVPPQDEFSSPASSADRAMTPVADSSTMATPPPTEYAYPRATPVPDGKALVGPSLGDRALGTVSTRLVLYTRDTSWADIRDARGTRLVYELLPAGRIVTIVGTPPFNVFLGNPDGVELEYQGESIAASQYKRGAVARFKVGMPVRDSKTIIKR